MSWARRLSADRSVRIAGSLGTFFGLKFALGLLLIGISTRFLSTAGFVAFSQLFLFLALLSTISAAGIQNGLVRQIALAQGDVDEERRAIAAALPIWLVAAAVTIAVTALLRYPISTLLVDGPSLAGILPLVALTAAGGGFGLLACAIFNGRRRAPTSLVLQSVGLALGGALCIWRLYLGDAIGAVVGYAVGPLVTGLLGAWALARSGIGLARAGRARWPDVRLLLGYSLVFLAVAAIMPSTLFALRHIYRDAFGTDLLSYWLAANRVSDVTSQILGLYMAQIFLPQATHEADPERARRLILRTLILGSAIMLGGWLIFVLGAPFFVTTFLSAAYLPAIPFIAGYLLGDGLRVTSSLTIHLMLARGRLAATIAVEAATAVLLTLYLVSLAALGRGDAPYWAYPAAYATMALILLPALLRRRRKIESSEGA